VAKRGLVGDELRATLEGGLTMEPPNGLERVLAATELGARILIWLVLFIPVALYCLLAIAMSSLRGGRVGDERRLLKPE
jgi:hypothetical protein